VRIRRRAYLAPHVLTRAHLHVLQPLFVLAERLVRGVELAQPTGDPRRADFDHTDATEFWDLVNRQDWAICEAVQQGISSRVHTHGYYAPMENASLDIRRYIEEKLGPAN